MESSIAYEITIKYEVKLTKLKCIFEDLGFLKVLLRELLLEYSRCVWLIDTEVWSMYRAYR